MTLAQSSRAEGRVRRGCRELYLSGGEPMLWRDGSRIEEDIVVEARRLGYFHVHVYTNGCSASRRRPTWSGSAWTAVRQLE